MPNGSWRLLNILQNRDRLLILIRGEQATQQMRSWQARQWSTAVCAIGGAAAAGARPAESDAHASSVPQAGTAGRLGVWRMAGVWSSSLLPQEIELVSPPTNPPTTQACRPRGRIPTRGICLVRVESVESAVGKKFETGDREISSPGLISFHRHDIVLRYHRMISAGGLDKG
jgi:hypothetical protein